MLSPVCFVRTISKSGALELELDDNVESKIREVKQEESDNKFGENDNVQNDDENVQSFYSYPF